MTKLARNRSRNINPWLVGIPVTIVVGAVTYAAVRILTSDGGLPSGTPPPMLFEGVPFADGGRNPRWPVVTNHDKAGLVSYLDTSGNTHGNWARRFGAPRDSRYHAGMDVYAYAGDPVVAMLDGRVLATQTFHLGSDAILVDHGDFVVLYGEVGRKSWNEFGLNIGDKVSKGQTIARVACMQGTIGDCSSHMLHLETYAPGTTKNLKFYRNKPPPAQLRDPTMLLLRAQPSLA